MKRPTGVTVIGVLAIVIGALQILASVAYFGIRLPALLRLTSASSAIVGVTALAGGWSLLFGVLAVVFGIGALRLSSWAWTMGVVLFIIDLIAAVVFMFATGLTLDLAIVAIVAIVLLAYLYSNDVRTAFGHPPGGVTRGTHGPSPA